jgi:hypothetical protein
MKLYRVIAHGAYNTPLSISEGYETRSQAARVAAGLAESGKAPHGVSIEQYESNDGES